jgi:hypothetical protein
VAGSYLTFTDSGGAAQLDNGMTAIAGGVGSRFRNWTSESIPIGVDKTCLGTGQRVMFVFRTDYKATFEMEEIPNANVAILDRLIAWLLLGNACAVYTGDSSNNSYATCGLAEGAKPAKAMFDKNNITWKLTLSLVNLAGSPSAMTCIYSS